jgi:hypothetical protein
MSTISRRNFLKKNAAALGAMMVAGPSGLLSSQKTARVADLRDRLFSLEFAFGYDPECFESSERIFFEEYHKAYLCLFIKTGRNLDIRLYTAASEGGLFKTTPLNLSGVSDCVDILLENIWSPELFYKIEYKDGKTWKSLESRRVKTPNVDLASGGKIKIIFKGDDHAYADLKHQPNDPQWCQDVLRGDYIAKMLREIIANPEYRPEIPLHKVMNGFFLAHTLKYILESNPDLVIDLGDTVGIDSYRIWGLEGNWPELLPENNLAEQSRILWERKRRTLASITPETPFYQVLGNHDGECNWSDEEIPFTQSYAKVQRKRVFRHPETQRMFEGLRVASGLRDGRYANDDWEFKNKDQNYYPVVWANGDVRLYALDVNSYLMKKPKEIYDWTLGPKQKNRLESMIHDGVRSPWKFMCFHNTLGGYSLGPGLNKGAYGRGPLFTREDYERINEIDPRKNIDPDRVEQVWLTELARQTETRGFFYAHDHIFAAKNIGKTIEGKDMMGICAGATTWTGADVYQNIWSNPYWVAYYGDYYDVPPPFLTPPGVAELEIENNSATIKYVCTAPHEIMYANMPEGTKPGDVLKEYQLSR